MMTDVLPPTSGHAAEARLLVVDDEPNIVELLSASLRFAGFEVATAMNGGDAVKAVERYRPDLVLLDVMLPRRDGFEVCQRLRADGWTDLKIVMLTAKGREAEMAKGIDVGADSYVTKPFSTRELVDHVARILEGDR